MTEQAAAETRPRGLPLGRLLGIPVYLAPSWVVIALFITVSAAGQYADQYRHGAAVRPADWAVGFLVAVLLAASVLAHELGHSVISLVLGIPIRRITLFLFGGYAEISRESHTPAEEYLIAIAGPLVSLLLGGAGVVAARSTGPDTAVNFVATSIGTTNVLLGILNLLPGLPLDGGRVLRAIVWNRTRNRARATRAGVIGGKVIAGLLALVGVLGLAGGERGAIFTLLVAGFLWTSAGAMGRQTAVASRVPALHARTLAHPALAVPAGLPLAEALRQGSAARSWLFAVDSYGRPSGVLSASAVEAVPAARRPWVTVGEVCRTIIPGLVIPADLAGQAVIDAISTTPAAEYLVVEPDGAVVGVLAARDVARQIDPRLAGVVA